MPPNAPPCITQHVLVIWMSLLESGSRIDPQDSDRRSPLHHSSRSDRLYVTLLLLENGADLELEDEVGFRPLHYACTFGQELTAMKLMDLGADVWAMDKSGWGPIIHAAAGDNSDNLEYAQVLVNRISRPREFPQPDPSKFIVVGDGSLEGVPTWLLIGLVILLCSIAILLPGCMIIRRCQRASRQDLMITLHVFGMLMCCQIPRHPRKGGFTNPRQASPMKLNMKTKTPMNLSTNYFHIWRWQRVSCKSWDEWERVNVNAINDFHRVKNRWVATNMLRNKAVVTPCVRTLVLCRETCPKARKGRLAL